MFPSEFRFRITIAVAVLRTQEGNDFSRSFKYMFLAFRQVLAQGHRKKPEYFITQIDKVTKDDLNRIGQTNYFQIW